MATLFCIASMVWARLVMRPELQNSFEVFCERWEEGGAVLLAVGVEGAALPDRRVAPAAQRFS